MTCLGAVCSARTGSVVRSRDSQCCMPDIEPISQPLGYGRHRRSDLDRRRSGLRLRISLLRAGARRGAHGRRAGQLGPAHGPGGSRAEIRARVWPSDAAAAAPRSARLRAAARALRLRSATRRQSRRRPRSIDAPISAGGPDVLSLRAARSSDSAAAPLRSRRAEPWPPPRPRRWCSATVYALECCAGGGCRDSDWTHSSTPCAARRVVLVAFRVWPVRAGCARAARTRIEVLACSTYTKTLCSARGYAHAHALAQT